MYSQRQRQREREREIVKNNHYRNYNVNASCVLFETEYVKQNTV